MSLPTNPAPPSPRPPLRDRARHTVDAVLDGVAATRRWLAAAVPIAGRTLAALLTAAAGVAWWRWGSAVPWWAWTALLVALVVLRRQAVRAARRDGRIASALDPLAAVRADAAKLGGGSFIGLDADVGGIVHAPSETALLVIGPPRRGKTSSVVIPTVLTAAGPVVSTSTKPDVLLATAKARSRFGGCGRSTRPGWPTCPTG